MINKSNTNIQKEDYAAYKRNVERYNQHVKRKQMTW